MSVEHLTVVLHHSRAAGTDKLVLLGIANHAGDGGAWPAIATLARYANVSTRSATRAIHNLIELGEVHVDANAGGTQGTRKDRRPNRYEVLVRCPENCDRSTQHRPRGDTDDAPSDPRGDTGDRHGVTQTSTEPSFEPSLKPSPPPSERDREKAEIKERAEDLAEKFWDWFSRTNGIDPPQTKGKLGVRAVFAACLRRGWSERDIKAAAASLDCNLTVGNMTQARNRPRRSGPGQPRSFADEVKANML